jgi:SAM-dependent methyltransferase
MQTKGVILNIGCGGKLIPEAINIDITPEYGVDMVLDMVKTPWTFADGSISGIYLSHFLEHTREPVDILKECHRVLKVGGFLKISVPHSSCAMGIGCFGHYRTFSYNTLGDYLSRPFYVFTKPLFRTVKRRIIWQPRFEWTPIQWLIDLSPRVFERFWAFYVGGAYEVQYEGIKI